LLFKGSGFYATDYRKPAPESAGEPSSDASKKKEGGAADGSGSKKKEMGGDE